MLPPLLALLPVPAVLLPAGAEAELLPDPAAAVLEGTTSVAVSTGVVDTAEAVLYYGNGRSGNVNT